MERPLRVIVLFGAKATYVFALVVAAIVIAGVIFTNSLKEVQSDVNNNRTYSVEGYAKKDVVPDTAQVTLGVVLEGQSTVEIQKRATDSYNKVIDALKASGVAETDIKTQNYTVRTTYDIETGKNSGYAIDLALVITVRDTNPESKKVSDVIRVAGENGFNSINNLNFYLDDTNAVRDQLKEEAIKDAKARAEKQAAIAGLKLGKVVTMFDNYYDPYVSNEPYYGMEASAKAGDAMAEPMPNVQIQPGQTEVQVTVTVEYELL